MAAGVLQQIEETCVLTRCAWHIDDAHPVVLVVPEGWWTMLRRDIVEAVPDGRSGSVLSDCTLADRLAIADELLADWCHRRNLVLAKVP